MGDLHHLVWRRDNLLRYCPLGFGNHELDLDDYENGHEDLEEEGYETTHGRSICTPALVTYVDELSKLVMITKIGLNVLYLSSYNAFLLLAILWLLPRGLLNLFFLSFVVHFNI